MEPPGDHPALGSGRVSTGQAASCVRCGVEAFLGQTKKGRSSERPLSCVMKLFCWRPAGRRDYAVHAQVFDHLPVVVLRVAKDDDGAAEPRAGPAAERI